MRSTVLWLLTAGSLALGPAPSLAGQAPATEETEPLFTRGDALVAGGFLLGAAALAPLDIYLAEQIQDSVPQANPLFRAGAGALEILGFPGSVVVGGTIYALGRVLDDRALADVGLHTTEAILVAAGVTGVGKVLVGRARPYLEPEDPFDLELGRGLTHDRYQSFPSGHTAAAFATAAALTTEIGQRAPEAKVWSGVVLYGAATLVGVSRMYHNKHWASDVAVGAAIGSFAGWKVVRYTHTHPDNPVDRVLLPRVVPAPGGVVLLWSFRPGERE